MSTPHHYPPLSHQLNLPDDIGDINCLCYWLKSERMKQRHSHTWSCVFVKGMSCQTASMSKKTGKKRSKSKIKSAHQIIVGYVGATYTLLVLSNYPVPVKLQGIFFIETKTEFKQILVLPFHKQNISPVGFVHLAVIRLEAPWLNFLY